MIDLNYLYAYATSKNSIKGITPTEYMQAQAFTKEALQNWAGFYEGIFLSRINEVRFSDSTLPINSVDLFLLALNELNIEPKDFLDCLSKQPVKEYNAIDKFFYSIYPNSRIFSAFNELRERGNTAYFGKVKRSVPTPSYNTASDIDFLFSKPVQSSSEAFMKKILMQLTIPTKKGTRIISESESALLYATFFLYDNQLSENIPNILVRHLPQITEYLARSRLHINDTIEDRAFLYNKLFYKDFKNANWDLYEPFPNFLTKIDTTGKAIFEQSNSNANILPMYKILELQQAMNEDDLEFMDEDTKKIGFTVTKEKCDAFKQQIVGQKEAVQTILNKLASVSWGFGVDNKPVASFLLNGPTGVGKTETAKAIAKTFFNNKLYTIDMSNYKHTDALNRLTGSSPGYVGSQDAVPFIEFIKENPSSVLLFDEIDKSSPACLTFLLGLLDEGKFTSAKGELVDVSNCVIIATTNQKANTNTNYSNRNLDEITAHTNKEGAPFLKEFLGRFDNILEYSELTEEELKEILDMKLNKLIKSFNHKQKNKNITLQYGEQLLDDILVQAKSKVTGARALNQGIQKYFIDNVTGYLVENGETRDAIITVADSQHLIVNGKIIKTNVTLDKTAPKIQELNYIS